MGYLDNVVSVAKPTQTVKISEKEVFKDGTHYIIWGVGNVGNNTTSNLYWDNSAKGSKMEAILKPECGLYCDEVKRGDKSGGWINWIYTGSTLDPVHVLKLDEPSLDEMRSRRKYTGNFVVKQPQELYIVPVLKVESQRVGKTVTFDLENGTYYHLVLTASQMQKVIDEAKRWATEENADMAGRLIQVDIDRLAKNKGDVYKFQSNQRIFTPETNPEMHEKFQEERLEIVKRIDAVIDNVHGGVFGAPKSEQADVSAANVWSYMFAQTGLDRNAFIEKYYSGPAGKLIDEEGESGLPGFGISDDEE